MFFWNCDRVLRVFSSGGLYTRKGGIRGAAGAPHHVVAREGGGPRHLVVWPLQASFPSLLLTLCSPQTSKVVGFCPVRFREYFLNYFSETEKQQKTGTGTGASC